MGRDRINVDGTGVNGGVISPGSAELLGPTLLQ